MATSATELSKYLAEHYAYEILMLRYTRARLQTARDLEWNAMFESLAMHARILRDFYTNRGQSDDRKACEYGVPSIRPSKKINSILSRVNKQIAHLDKGRPYGVERKKLRGRRVDAIADWIEKKHTRFIKRCDANSKVGWKEPILPPLPAVTIVVGAPSSSAYSQTWQSGGPTGPGHAFVYSTDKSPADEEKNQ